VYKIKTLKKRPRPKKGRRVIIIIIIIMGDWRKLHNEELHNLYSSPNIIRMIKSRRMRWAGYVARMGRRGMHIGYWWESQKKETTRKTKT
jgi:hypothetical protein